MTEDNNSAVAVSHPLKGELPGAFQYWVNNARPEDRGALDRAFRQDPDGDDTDARASALIIARAVGLGGSATGYEYSTDRSALTGKQYLEMFRDVARTGSLESLKSENFKEWEALGDDFNAKLEVARKRNPKKFKYKVGEANTKLWNPYWLSDEERKVLGADFTEEDRALVKSATVASERIKKIRNTPMMETRRVMYGTPEPAWFREQGRISREQSEAVDKATLKTVKKRVAELREMALQRMEVARYESVLEEENPWLVAQAAKGGLQTRLAGDMFDALVENKGKLPEYWKDGFVDLPRGDRQMLIMASSALKSVPGRSWAGDVGRAFWRGIWETPIKSGRQIRLMAEAAMFGDMATGDMYQHTMEMWADLEALESEAVRDWGFAGNAVVGVAGTLAYMGYAASGVGSAAIFTRTYSDFHRRVALEGGDVSTLAAHLQAAGAAAAYVAVEKVQFQTAWGRLPTGGKRKAYINLASGLKNVFKKGAGPSFGTFLHAVGVVGLDYGKTVVEETLEEGVQRVIEEFYVAIGLGRDAAAAMAEGFWDEIHGSLGTMLVLGAFGGARKMHAFRDLGYFDHGKAGIAERAGALVLAQELMLRFEHGDYGKRDLNNFGDHLGTLFRGWLRADGRADVFGQDFGLDYETAKALAEYFRNVYNTFHGDADSMKTLTGGRNVLTAPELIEKAMPGTRVEKSADGTSFKITGTTDQIAWDLNVKQVDRDALPIDPLMLDDDARTVANERALVGAMNRQGLGITLELFRSMPDAMRRELVQALADGTLTQDMMPDVETAQDQEAAPAEEVAPVTEEVAPDEEVAPAEEVAPVTEEVAPVEEAAAPTLEEQMQAIAEALTEAGIETSAEELAGMEPEARRNHLLKLLEDARAPLWSSIVNALRAVGINMTMGLWRSMTPEARREIAEKTGLAREGMFKLEDADGNVVTDDDLKAMSPTVRGTVLINKDVMPKVQFHEIFHAVVRMMRANGMLTQEMQKTLVEMFGDPQTSGELFDEELAADSYRDYVAGRVDPVSQSLWERFADRIAKLLKVLRIVRESAADTNAYEAFFEAMRTGNLRGIPMALAKGSGRPSAVGSGQEAVGRVETVPQEVDSGRQGADTATRPSILQRGFVEQAEADARLLLDSEVMELMDTGESGDLSLAANRRFMNAFIEQTGDQSLRLSDGQPSPEAYARVRRAALAAVFDGIAGYREFLQQIFERGTSEDGVGVKREIDGIAKAAPRLVRLLRVKGDYGINAELALALARYMDYRNRGGRPGAIEQDIAQQDMFAQRDELVDELLRQIGTRNSSVLIGDLLNEYAARAMRVDPEPDMFGNLPPSRMEVLQRAVEETTPVDVAAIQQAEIDRLRALAEGSERKAEAFLDTEEGRRLGELEANAGLNTAEQEAERQELVNRLDAQTGAEAEERHSVMADEERVQEYLAARGVDASPEKVAEVQEQMEALLPLWAAAEAREAARQTPDALPLPDRKERVRQAMNAITGVGETVIHPADLNSLFEEGESVSVVMPEFYKAPYNKAWPISGFRIGAPQDVAALSMQLRSPYQEMFKAIYLDADNVVLDGRVLTVGLIDASLVSPSVVFSAMPEGTVSVILGHNHPSGDPAPSNADFEVSRTIIKVAKQLGVKVIDHVITNGTKYYSMAQDTTQSISFDSNLPTRQRGREVEAFEPSTAEWEISPLFDQAKLLAPEAVRIVSDNMRSADDKSVFMYGLNKKLGLLSVSKVQIDNTTDMEKVKDHIAEISLKMGEVLSIMIDFPGGFFGGALNFYRDHARLFNAFNEAGFGQEIVDTFWRDADGVFHSGRRQSKIYKQLDGADSKNARVTAEAETWAGRAVRDAVVAKARAAAAARHVADGADYDNARHSVTAQPRVLDEVVSSTSVRALRMHEDFDKAKTGGDGAAAKRIVERFLKLDKIEPLKERVDRLKAENPGVEIYIVPVLGVEETSLNRIPIQLALRLSEELGIPVWQKLFHASKGHNTDAPAAERGRRIHHWIGEAPPENARLILVDDTYTTGQTLSSLADQVGEPETIVTLSSGRYTKKWALTGETENKLLDKAGMTLAEFEALYEEKPTSRFTEAQARQYLLNGGRGRDALLSRFPKRRSGEEHRGGQETIRGGGQDVYDSGSLSQGASDRVDSRHAWGAQVNPYDEDLRALRAVRVADIIATDKVKGIHRSQEEYEQLARANNVDLERAREQADRVLKTMKAKRPTAEQIHAAIAADSVEQLFSQMAEREGKMSADMATIAQKTLMDVRRKAIDSAPEITLMEWIQEAGIDPSVDFVRVAPALFDPEYKPSPRKPEDKDSKDGAGDPYGASDPDAWTAEQRAQIEKNRAEANEKARKLIAWLEAWRTQYEVEQEMKRKKREEARQKRKEADGAEIDADEVDDEDVEDTFVMPLIDGVSAGIETAQEFAAVLREGVRRWILQRQPGANAEGDVFGDEQNVEVLRRSAQAVLRDLTRKLIDPNATKAYNALLQATRDIAQLRSADAIEHRVAHVVAMIHRNMIRLTRKQLMKELDTDIRTIAVKGKTLDKIELERNRKISGRYEAAARFVRRMLGWSSERVREEIAWRNEQIDMRTRAYSEEDDSRELDAEDDVKIRQWQEELGALERWGGLKEKMPGEIMAATQDIKDWLETRRFEHAQRQEENKLRRDDLSRKIERAVTGDVNKPRPEWSGFARFWDASTTATLRQRLEAVMLNKGQTAAQREEAQQAIDDVMYMVSKGTQTYRALEDEYHKQILGAVNEAVKGTDMGVRDFLKMLDEKIPEELNAQISSSEQGTAMTWGQALNLYGMLCQTQTYAKNIVLHGRQHQRQILKKALPVQMLKFVSIMREIYQIRRQQLSPVQERVTGFDIANPDPLYMPAKMYLEPHGELDMEVRSWNPIPRQFAPRVDNNRDFDESMDIINAAMQSARNTALTIAFAESGLDLRSIVARSSTFSAIQRFHGKAAAQSIIRQLTDHLSGGYKANPTGLEWGVSKASALHTYTALSWNLSSTLKQMAGVGGWAAVLDGGVGEMWGYMMIKDKEAAAEILSSPGFVARYGSHSLRGMFREAWLDPTRGVISRFYRTGMQAIQLGDFVATRAVIVGLYKTLRDNYIKQGMDEAQARERAAVQAWALAEDAQQSDRPENTPEIMRRNNFYARQMYKFASANVLQASHEFHAIRQWRRLRDTASRKKMVNTILVNHFIIPMLMALVEQAVGLAIGGVPDDEKEWLKEAIGSLLLEMGTGPLAKILFVSNITRNLACASIKALGFKPRIYEESALPSVEMVDRLARRGLITASDIMAAEWEDVRDDLMQMLGAVNVPMRYADRAWSTWWEGESDEDRRAKRAAASRRRRERRE